MKDKFPKTDIDLFLLLQRRMKLASSTKNNDNIVKKIINNLYDKIWMKYKYPLQ